VGHNAIKKDVLIQWNLDQDLKHKLH
jgi:hypothetical protein